MRRLLLLPVIALVALFAGVAPASAATVTSFTVDGGQSATIGPGQSVTIAWETESTTQFARLSSDPVVEDFDNQDAPPNGSTDVTLDEPGTYTFTIDVSDGEGPDSATVTVVVADPDADSVVTPAPVTTPEPCVIQIPVSEGVSYSVGFAEDDIEGDDLEPGRYPVSDFTFLPDVDLVAFAAPRDGFAFPEDVQTEFPVEVTEDCFPTFVDAEAICMGVTFTNVSGEPITIFYSGLEDDGDDTEDGETELAPGERVTVDTRGDVLVFAAGRLLSEDEAIQIGFVDVEQDCIRPGAARTASHPTVAPAAGMPGSATHGGAIAVVASTLLGGAGLALRRRLS